MAKKPAPIKMSKLEIKPPRAAPGFSRIKNLGAFAHPPKKSTETKKGKKNADGSRD